MERLLTGKIKICRHALQDRPETLLNSEDEDTMERASRSDVLSPCLVAEETEDWPEVQADRGKRERKT